MNIHSHMLSAPRRSCQGEKSSIQAPGTPQTSPATERPPQWPASVATCARKSSRHVHRFAKSESPVNRMPHHAGYAKSWQVASFFHFGKAVPRRAKRIVVIQIDEYINWWINDGFNSSLSWLWSRLTVGLWLSKWLNNFELWLGIII